MKLCYSFDSRIDTFQTIEMLKSSMEQSKTYGYEIVFYGDSNSIDELKDSYDSAVDITHCNFQFRDEIKMYVHSKEDLDCVTIDSNILLGEPIDLSYASVWFLDKEHTERYKEMLEHFHKHGTEYNIHGFKQFSNTFVNMNLLKFNDEGVKEDLLRAYEQLKGFYLEVIEPEETLSEKGWDMSKILSEYYFGCLLEYNEINSAYLSDDHVFKINSN